MTRSRFAHLVLDLSAQCFSPELRALTVARVGALQAMREELDGSARLACQSWLRSLMRAAAKAAARRSSPPGINV
jgi:hypothetical protein